MWPIFYQFGPFDVFGHEFSLPINAFGTMMALAFLASRYVVSLGLKRKGYDPELGWTFMFWAAVGGLLGALLTTQFQLAAMGRTDMPESERPDFHLYVDEFHNFVAEDMVVHNSNVADAIRWALGENNARILRAKKNEELIFGGSETRKSLGMAEAILQLDNSSRRLPIEFTEVEVGRRLFRNGDAEYLVNRSRVRLRDLQDLLAGANLADNPFVVNGPLHVCVFAASGELLFEDYVGAIAARGRFEFTAGLTPARYRVVARSIWGAHADLDVEVRSGAAPALRNAALGF